jgi:hypothetical protein
MACSFEAKGKDQAIHVASMYLECAPFVSIAGKGGSYKIYPRVKDKSAFAACVGTKAPVNPEWVNGEKKDGQ